MLSPDWEAMFLPSRNLPYQYHQPQALVQLGICPPPHHTPPSSLIPISHLYPLFSVLTPCLPDCSWTIFHLAAIVSKQLYLMGWGFSSIIYIMLSNFIIFWLQNIWYMIVDPVQEMKIWISDRMWFKQHLFSYFSQKSRWIAEIIE